MSEHSPDHRPVQDVVMCHCAKVRGEQCDCTEARVMAAEMNALFDLQWKADQRAIKMWQEAHPGNDLTWPDRANMVVWLLEQLDART